MKTILIMIINIYQKAISQFLPSTCGFYPTCSEYTKKAIIKYGIIKGVYLGIKRILKCNPYNKGGYDPLE